MCAHTLRRPRATFCTCFLSACAFGRIGEASAEHWRRDGHRHEQRTHENSSDYSPIRKITNAIAIAIAMLCMLYVCHHVSARTHARSSGSPFPALISAHCPQLVPVCWRLPEPIVLSCQPISLEPDFGRMSGEFYKPEQLGTVRDSWGTVGSTTKNILVYFGLERRTEVSRLPFPVGLEIGRSECVSECGLKRTTRTRAGSHWW